jgi:hypothetical protein
MFRKSLTALIGMTLALGAGAGFTQTAPTVRMEAPRTSTPRRQLRGTATKRMLYGAKGVGITAAQQQRAANKARNVRRHKTHVRGRK